MATTTTEPSNVTPATTLYLTNADKILSKRVDISAPLDVRNAQLISIVETLCPFMRENGTSFTVTQLSGGLSNILFIISSSPHEENNKQVLVRMFSESLEESSSLVDIPLENKISAWLSLQQKAPLYFGRFENGRVEEFYSGYTPLSSNEMHLYAPKIASLLASLHELTPPPSVLPPLDPTYNKRGQCWITMQQWLNLARKLHNESDVVGSVSLSYLQQEIKWLESQLTTTPANDDKVTHYFRQVVFCHMDAQSLNLLLNQENSLLKLIDFEYASYNPRAADIANTWCEYCDMNNLRASYKTQYPTIPQQDTFIQAYLQAMGDETKFGGENYPDIRLQVNRHALISHLLWTIWSLVQSKQSDIKFDYLGYAQQRMEGYELFKQLYF